jgi:hypothetical protein
MTRTAEKQGPTLNQHLQDGYFVPRDQLHEWILQGISASTPAKSDAQSNIIAPNNSSTSSRSGTVEANPLDRESRDSTEAAIQPPHLPNPNPIHQLPTALDDYSSRIEVDGNAENALILGKNSVKKESNRQDRNDERSERIGDLLTGGDVSTKAINLDAIRENALARQWDFSSFLCGHDRLDPMKCMGLRLISAVGGCSTLRRHSLVA